MGIAILRKKAEIEEIDHPFVMSCLSDYKRPYDKITTLLQSKDLIRVKKGLYVFGTRYAKEPYSLELLANLIYGPSYLSLESALSFYGLIPERVFLLMSMTLKKNKFFHTPIGNFAYHHLSEKAYTVGTTITPLDDRHHIIIATKEKAAADLVAKKKDILSLCDMETFLFENMRILKEDFATFSITRLQEIAKAYQNKKVDLLLKLWRHIHA